MRPPLLFLVLLVVLGLALGLRVMLRQAPSVTMPPAPIADPARDFTAAPLAGGVPQGHVYSGITDEPDNCNPFTAHGITVRRYVLGFTHEGLLDTDPQTGALRPALASAYEIAADGLSCTFTLRDGVCFADGSLVTMADVMFGWELAKAGHLELGFVNDAFGRVAAAEVLDARHLRVHWKGVFYAVVRAVGESWLVAKRQFFVDRVAAIAARLGQPMPAVDSAEFAGLLRQIDRECGPGTGPFQLPSDANGPSTWRRRQDLLLLQNPHHWQRQQKPGTWNLAGVRLLFRDKTVAHTELYERRVDWFYDPNGETLLQNRPDLQQDYRTVVYDHPTQGILGMLWNCRRPPLDDARVRRALGHLFDRQAVVALYHGKAVPAKALAKTTAAEYPTAFEPLAFDPAQARRLLREAGYDGAAGKPLRLSVLMASGDPQQRHALDLFVDAAKRAGVEIAAQELEFTAFVAQKTRAEWDGLWVVRSLRAWGDPYDFVHSEGADNDGHWQDAEADRLASAARAELDEGKRTALLRALHERVHAEQPLALVVHPLVAILFNKHIQDAAPGPRGLWPERFWVPRQFQRR